MAMAEQQPLAGGLESSSGDSSGTNTPQQQQQQQQQQPTATKKSGTSARPSPPSARPGAGPPRRPSPEEMIEYYSSKGLDRQAASEKVIDDLQKALTVAVGRYPRKAQEVEKSVKSFSGTLDSLSTRLESLEVKVDKKPDVGGVFVAGVAAGGMLQAVPHVFNAVSQIGRSLKESLSSRS